MMPIKLVLKKKTILAFVINLAVIEAGLEAVNEKTVPKTASAIKTFKDCTSFNRLMAYL